MNTCDHWFETWGDASLVWIQRPFTVRALVGGYPWGDMTLIRVLLWCLEHKGIASKHQRSLSGPDIRSLTFPWWCYKSEARHENGRNGTKEQSYSLYSWFYPRGFWESCQSKDDVMRETICVLYKIIKLRIHVVWSRPAPSSSGFIATGVRWVTYRHTHVILPAVTNGLRPPCHRQWEGPGSWWPSESPGTTQVATAEMSSLALL